MGDQETPVTTPDDQQGSTPAEGSPGTGSEGVGTGAEVVEKARFDGLMSSMNKEKAEKERLMAELEVLKGQVQEQQKVTEGVPPEVLAELRAASSKTETVFNLYRSSEVSRMLEKYPYASESDVRGDSPTEWAESIEAAHNRVSALVEERAKEARVQAEEEARKRYGAPLGISGEGASAAQGAAEISQEDYRKAVESGDTQAAAKALLMMPVE